MVSICTMGKFWPQAGHGIWSDGGRHGVNSHGDQYHFQMRDVKIPKLKLRKRFEKNDSCEPMLKIEIRG